MKHSVGIKISSARFCVSEMETEGFVLLWWEEVGLCVRWAEWAF